MTKFATYLHPQISDTAKPIDQIDFVGFSAPHYSRLRQLLADALTDYPVLPLREADLELFGAVHTAEYLEKLTRMAQGEQLAEPPKLSLECTGFEYCLPGYRYGLGGMIEAIDQMKTGHLDRAFCMSFGGHHAYPDWGHGYCLLNPLAAAARYAQGQGFNHILMLDWDIHHGDGTQAIFAHDKHVYCISIHSAADLYMWKVAGIKHGTTTAGTQVGHCNIPILHRLLQDSFAESTNLPGKFYRGEESLPAFRQSLDHLPWNPDLIMIFAGFDGHRDDCGKNITDWDDDDFRRLTRFVVELSQQLGCPILSVQGGGYNLPVTLSATINHVATLAG